MKKYLIVGGVAGGASAAARLRRNDENARIVIFEKGRYISYANCGLPYYIGGLIEEREKLFVQKAENFAKRFNIDVRTRNEVVGIDRNNRRLKVIDLESSHEYEESYDKVILSPGAKPIKPDIKGIDLPGIFTLRNVEDTDRIKEYIRTNKPRKAIVIGAGYIGIEMAENLQMICSEVTLVEMQDRILPFFDFEISSALVRHVKAQGVRVLLKEKVVEFRKESEGIIAALDSGKTVSGEIVIFAAGVRPDTDWLGNSGLMLSGNGSIAVDQFLRTNDENIYAIGDAIVTDHLISEQKINAYLAGPANKQGRIAADNIAYRNSRVYKGALGTAIIKVFRLTAGICGISEDQLLLNKIGYHSTMIHSASHAGYYPDATPVSLKLLYSPGNGKILGMQIIGYQGVDKRLDVVSALMQRQGTIHDLTEFEHSYAPPYSSARDPLTLAGYVSENVLNKRFKSIRWQDLDSFRRNSELLLDVRSPEEFDCCTIPGSVNIPLDELRQRIGELPEDREIVIFCQAGLRGYLACRILIQKGFHRVHNLSGGFKTYQFVYCRDKSVDIYAGEKILPDDQLSPACKYSPCPYSY